jgi:hypothetical protein
MGGCMRKRSVTSVTSVASANRFSWDVLGILFPRDVSDRYGSVDNADGGIPGGVSGKRSAGEG